MRVIVLDEWRTKLVFQKEGIELPLFIKTLEKIEYSNDLFFQKNPKFQQMHRALVGIEGEEIHPTFQKQLQKDQTDWSDIKEPKTGNRSYISRLYVKAVSQHTPKIYRELIEPNYFVKKENQSLIKPTELSVEMDTLLLLRDIPGMIAFLQEVYEYRKGIFNNLKRLYLAMVEERYLDSLASFLELHELQLDLVLASMHQQVLNEKEWNKMIEYFLFLAERSDPSHSNALSDSSVGSLISIYVSLSNIALLYRFREGSIPAWLLESISTFSKHFSFNKSFLEKQLIWERYQQHLFLFMRRSPDLTHDMIPQLQGMSPAEKIYWIGALSHQEMHNLLVPLTNHTEKLSSLIKACLSIKHGDPYFDHAQLVWKEIEVIYRNYLQHQQLSSEMASIFSSLQENVEEMKNIQEKGLTEDLKKMLFKLKKVGFLLVGEDKQMITQIQLLLPKIGFQKVFSANQIESAKEVFLQKNLSIVLGFEKENSNLVEDFLIESMKDRKCYHSMILIAVLPNYDKDKVFQLMAQGAKGYLLQPFSFLHLLSELQELQLRQQTPKIL